MLTSLSFNAQDWNMANDDQQLHQNIFISKKFG